MGYGRSAPDLGRHRRVVLLPPATLSPVDALAAGAGVRPWVAVGLAPLPLEESTAPVPRLVAGGIRKDEVVRVGAGPTGPVTCEHRPISHRDTHGRLSRNAKADGDR